MPLKSNYIWIWHGVIVVVRRMFTWIWIDYDKRIAKPNLWPNLLRVSLWTINQIQFKQLMRQGYWFKLFRQIWPKLNKQRFINMVTRRRDHIYSIPLQDPWIKPVLIEIVSRWPSSETSKTILMRQTRPTWGMAYNRRNQVTRWPSTNKIS